MLTTLRLAVFNEMFILASCNLYLRCDVTLYAGFNLSILMGVCGVIVLGASSGQMSVILAGAAAGEEVIIHTFGVMDVGMLMLLAFLTCREHLFWILFTSLV